jgi:hypothetical protein
MCKKEMTTILIPLDDKGYYFKEIPYNYTIAKKIKNKDGSLYKNLAFYPTAYGALNYYIRECNHKKTNVTVEELKNTFRGVEDNIKKVLGDLSDAKRKYETKNELLKEDVKTLKEQLERCKQTEFNMTKDEVNSIVKKYKTYKTKYYNLKKELKDNG